MECYFWFQDVKLNFFKDMKTNSIDRVFERVYNNNNMFSTVKYKSANSRKGVL